MAAFFSAVIALLAVMPLALAFALPPLIRETRVSEMHRMLQLDRMMCQTDEGLNELDLYGSGVSCSCKENAAGYTLECSDKCSNCYVDVNSGINVCMRQSFYSTQYDHDGDATSQVEVWEYTRSEGDGVPSRGTELRLEYEEPALGQGSSPHPCALLVDGEKCASCVRQSCGIGYYGATSDCSNLLPGTTGDQCSDTYTGAFEYLGLDTTLDCSIPSSGAPIPGSEAVMMLRLLAFVSVLASCFFM